MQADLTLSFKTTPDDELKQRPGQTVGIEAEIPYRKRIEAWPFHPDVKTGPRFDCTGTFDFLGKVREELCKGCLTGAKQGMSVPRLWRAGPRLRSLRKHVTVQDSNFVKITRGRLGGGQACYTRSNDNSMSARQFRH